RDAQGNTVGGSSIPVTASIQSGSGGTVGGTFTVNAVNGVATFNNLTVSGLTNTPYVLRFSAGSLVVADSSPFTLQAGSAAQLAITTQPAAGPSGGFLGIQPVVEVRDSAGNKVSSSAPITVEIFSGLGGTLGGVKTVNAVNGVATFYDLTLAGKVGVNYGLRFSSGSLAAADSINVAVTGAGTPVRLVLTSQPVGAASGGVLAVQPVVAVQDLGGNTITSASGVVQVTINSGTGGSLGGVSSVNITGGVATFSNLTLAGTVGVPYSLRFSSAGLTPADSLNVLVTPGTPTQLWVTTHPLGGQSGQPLATAPVVVVRDAQGNTVTSSTAAITAALTSGAGATLSGQTTLNAVGGIATFSGLTVSGTVGTNFMLQFTSPGLAPVNSNSFTLTPGATSRLVLTTQPTGGPSGSALSVQPVVAIRDAQGNTVTSGAVTVTATILSGTGGTLSGQQTVTSVNGQAVFSSLALAGTAGTPYVIRFTAEGLTAADSGNVILTPGAATQLAITTQPTGGASGTNLNNQPVITIRDAQGNTVTNSTLPVSVTVSAGTGGTLGGTATVNAQSGVATFNGLTLAGLVGTSYTLRFAAPGLPSTDSTAVTVTPGLASKIAITTQPVGGPSGAVLSTQPVVTIQDAQGNTVTTSTVTVSVSLQSGTGGTLGGTTTVNAVGGVATFSGLTLAGAVGTSYVLRFSATGLSTIDSSFVTVAAGTATRLAVSTQPVGGQSGALLASQPVVTVRDSQGNPVLTSSTVVSVIISSGTGGSLGGTTTATTVNGVATFANLTLSGKVGTQYILKFSTAEFSVDSVALTVTPGQPTQLAIATAPVAGTSGAVFTAPPAISIRDAQSNLVTSSQVPVSVSILTGSGGTLGGSATVNAVNGIATFNNLTLSGPAGTSYILQFTSPGLAPISSSSITLAGGGTPTQMTLLAGNNQIATVGALLSTAPGVIVRDSSSNPVAGVSVVFAVASGGGTITGATQTTNSSGVATVGSWTLGTTAGTNTLTATVSGVTPITFTATGVAGPPSQLTINAGNNQSAQGGVAVAIKPSVIVRDANNNPVANVTVTFAVTLGGGTVTGATTVTSSTGVATVGSWTLGATAGINTLTASSSGLAPVTFTATSGTPPSINAVSGLVRTAGTLSSNAAIAYISDSETPAANLTVTMTSPSLSGGVTIDNLYNNNGTVTADISINCGAAAGTGTFTLQVTDGSSTASATLSIGVTANTPPALRYGSVGQTTPMISVNAGLSSSLAPSVSPSDNVVVNSVAAISKGTFTGNVLPDSNGLVSFTNAGPVGLHTITIRATDNCGAFTDATILIEVTNITTSSPMVASGDSVIGPGSTLTLRQTLTNSTAVPGNVTFVATIPGSITPINCTSDSEGQM
ncbi:MAG: hypothetical protein EBU88_10015, partial [Acidobacteria bacterium]|nr:hypothetical protein [Acidobacteriota bacterium]